MSQTRIYSFCPQSLGFQAKHPAAVCPSKQQVGGLSGSHPPNCEMGTIRRSDDCEGAQVKQGRGQATARVSMGEVWLEEQK